MNDDDVDFKPSQSTRTNLTSLFDTNRPRPAENQTLTYTPPKPPKPKVRSSTPIRGSTSRNLGTEKLEIIISKNIQLYKLENGKYVGQGAAGIAIIGHFDLHIYQIILYKNNKEYLSKTYVQPSFTFTVLENNYASFYDNARQNWSVLFPSSSEVQLFAKQVAIARFNSQSKKEKIIVQDLIPLDSAGVNKHDIVKFECSCSLLNFDEIIPFKEKSKWSVEITDMYTFPWQEGLKDCGYKCKRVVITPYNLSAPWKDEIHESNSVLVEFEIESISHPEHLVLNETASVKEKILDERITDSSAHEDNCNVKPGSLTDSLFSSKSDKADLISRIARVGQALPSKVTFANSSSDSPVENPPSSRDGSNLSGGVTNVAHQQINQTVPSNFRQSSPLQTDIQQAQSMSGNSGRRTEYDITWQQQPMTGGMNFVYQELRPVMTGPPGPSEQGYAKAPETVGTDAELRITINKVSEKVDFLLNKLQNLDPTGWNKVKAHQSAVMLDPVNVINSIQDVMAENENLKMEIEQQKSKIKEQGCKLHSLMELTQKCVERCAYPERKSATTSAAADQIFEFEEKLDISGKLITEANAKIKQLTFEIENYRKEIAGNQEEIKQLNAEIQVLVDKLTEKERVIQSTETKLFESAAAKKAVIAANEMLKKEIQNFKQQGGKENPAELKTAMSEDSVEEIKKVMNAVNRKLQSYFNSDEPYLGKDIKVAISTTLKDVTMEYLKYRTKQITLFGQRTGQGTSDEKRGISDVQNADNPGTEDTDHSRKEKSKIESVSGKFVSQKLSLTDEQPFHGSVNITEKATEKSVKLNSGLVTVEGGGSLQENNTVRTETSHPIINAFLDGGKISQSMKNDEIVYGESPDLSTIISGEFKSRSQSQPSRVKSTDEQDDHASDRYPGGTIAGSNRTAERTTPADSKTSIIPSSTNKSSTLSSHLSEGNRNLKQNTDELLEEHLAKSLKDENPNSTLSDDTKKSTPFPSSSRSVINNNRKLQNSPNIGVESSNLKESPTEITTTVSCQPTETEEILRKKLNAKHQTENLTGGGTFACVGGDMFDQLSIRPINFNSETELEAAIQKSNLVNLNKGKDSILRNKSEPKATEDSLIKEHAEYELSKEASDEKYPIKSQVHHKEKSDPVREERDHSKENDIDKSEGEERSNDGNVISPTSCEKLKVSGSNSAKDSTLYNDYYQGWESSKPPPLPLEDDEDSSGTNEEWL